MPDILDGLDPEQRAAVRAPRGPVCVLAGAGTGKPGPSPGVSHISPPPGRSPQAGPRGHLHSPRGRGDARAVADAGCGFGAGADLSRGRAASAAVLLAAGVRRTAVGVARQQVSGGLARCQPRGTADVEGSVRDLAAEIEWAKASLIGPAAYAEHVAEIGRETPQPADKVAQVFAGYERLKVNEDGDRLLDFDDLLIYTTEILRSERAVAEFRERYRCFVVDEYQDVTPVQRGTARRMARRP